MRHSFLEHLRSVAHASRCCAGVAAAFLLSLAVSGEVPEVPVISAKSGHLFERRLIEKYIEAEGTCPVTGESLSTSDLVEVKTNKVCVKGTHGSASHHHLMTCVYSSAAATAVACNQILILPSLQHPGPSFSQWNVQIPDHPFACSCIMTPMCQSLTC